MIERARFTFASIVIGELGMLVFYVFHYGLTLLSAFEPLVKLRFTPCRRVVAISFPKTVAV